MGREVDSEAEQGRTAEAENEVRKTVVRDALTGLVMLPLLFALDFIYQMLIKGPQGVNLIEVFEVPFDLILLTIGLLVGATYKGYSKPRDWPWAALVVGIVLILSSGAIDAYMQYKAAQSSGQSLPEYWNNLLTVYLPDGIGVGTLVWAMYGIRG